MTARRPAFLRLAHHSLVQLALVAMMLHALIPVGWMPNPGGARSGVPLAICTGHGPAVMHMADTQDQRNPHRHQGQSHQHDVCPFAAASHMALAATALPAAALTLVVLTADLPRQLGIAHQARANRAHPPRAPPPLI